jgi:hypothetical protein
MFRFLDPNDCKKDSFVCPDDGCIPAMWKCDGVPDCTAGSDEDPQLCRNGKAFINSLIEICSNDPS